MCELPLLSRDRRLLTWWPLFCVDSIELRDPVPSNVVESKRASFEAFRQKKTRDVDRGRFLSDIWINDPSTAKNQAQLGLVSDEQRVMRSIWCKRQ